MSEMDYTSDLQGEAEELHRKVGLPLADAADHVEATRAALARLLASHGAKVLVDFEDATRESERYTLAHLVVVNAKAGTDSETLLEWARSLAALRVGEEVTLEWWPIRRVQ